MGIQENELADCEAQSAAFILEDQHPQIVSLRARLAGHKTCLQRISAFFGTSFHCALIYPASPPPVTQSTFVAFHEPTCPG